MRENCHVLKKKPIFQWFWCLLFSETPAQSILRYLGPTCMKRPNAWSKTCRCARPTVTWENGGPAGTPCYTVTRRHFRSDQCSYQATFLVGNEQEQCFSSASDFQAKQQTRLPFHIQITKPKWIGCTGPVNHCGAPSFCWFPWKRACGSYWWVVRGRGIQPRNTYKHSSKCIHQGILDIINMGIRYHILYAPVTYICRHTHPYT